MGKKIRKLPQSNKRFLKKIRSKLDKDIKEKEKEIKIYNSGINKLKKPLPKKLKGVTKKQAKVIDKDVINIANARKRKAKSEIKDMKYIKKKINKKLR